MGKSRPHKQNRHNTAAVSPTGLPSVKNAELLEELVPGDVADIPSIVEKLSSASAEERAFALTTLTIHMSQKSSLQEILKHDILRIVGPLLQDPKDGVKSAASHLLRTLSEEGGFDVCELMIRKDMLTSLASFLKSESKKWASDVTAHKIAGVSAIIDSIYAIQNLCECSSLAVRLAIEDSVPQMLLSCMAHVSHPAQLPLAAAQCLYTMAEDNESIVETIKTPNICQFLVNFLKKQDALPYVKVIVAGLLVNGFGSALEQEEFCKNVLDTLLLVLTTDTSAAFEQTIRFSLNPSIQEEMANATPDEDWGGDEEACAMDEDGVMKKGKENLHARWCRQLEEFQHLVSSQKLSFEIISNMLAADDADDWSDVEEDNDCLDVSPDEDMEVAEEASGSSWVRSALCKSMFDVVLIERLKFIDTALYEEIENSDMTYRSVRKGLVTSYNNCLNSGLVCMNNLMSETKSIDELSATSDRFCLLTKDLIKLTTYPYVARDEDLIESISSAVRSLIEKQPHTVQERIFDDSELNCIHELSKSTHTQTAVNALRILALVGIAASKSPQGNPLIKIIGEALLQASTRSDNLSIMVESLDALMDVFSEDYNNGYLQDMNLIDRLQSALIELKKLKISKTDRQQDKLVPVLSTVKANLPRFIQYKKKMIKL